MITIFDDTKFDNLGPFEDEIDCAIIDDNDIMDAMEELGNTNSTVEDEIDDGEEVVDVNINYDESIPEADTVDMDADDIIAAERDIAFDPFDDDELIDIATSNDEINDDLVDDEE